MRVLSCNVNGRVRAALGRQADALLEHHPDIVALQEVTTGSYIGWRERLKESGYDFVSTFDLVAHPYPAPPYPSPPFPPKNQDRTQRQIERKNCNLVAARHPIELLPGLSFEDPDEARYAFPEKHVAARVTLDGHEVDVHNAHLPPGVSRGVIKVHAFEAIARRVAEDSDRPTILCGDFNAPWSEDADGPVTVLRRKRPEDIKKRWIEAEKGVVANAQMRDVYRDVHDPRDDFPASHVTGDTAHRYDYIFATADLNTESCEYLGDWLDRDKPDGRLSDHAPVVAELSLAA